MKDKKDKIVSMLKDFLGNKQAIIGISGGIDSAVVTALCVEAVGRENVFGLTLPFGNQDTSEPHHP
jgi:NAD+ synthase